MVKKTFLTAAFLTGLTGILIFDIEAGAATGSSKAPVLLELFTSEGCSSCPPADQLLQTLDAKQPFDGAELIVLSEHVDYWNGSGWTDSYSSKLFSARQRSYAEHLGMDDVYTPEMVIDGERAAVGGNAVEIRNAVEAALHNRKVAVTVANPVRDGNQIKFHLSSADLPTGEGSATVYVALAENKVQSNVAGGENGGRSLTHVAVVRELSAVGTVKGGTSLSKDISLPLPSRAGSSGFRVVAFLQNDRSHKIVGATYEKLAS